VLGDSNALIPW